jgi:hypothetical protein
MKKNLKKILVMGNKFLSPDGFQKWLKIHDIKKQDERINEKVYPKIKFSELVEKIEVHEGNDFENAKCFRKNGGLIVESINEILTIKTKKGLFSIEESDIKYKKH